MNVIVTNRQKNIIDNANIDAIKDFNGLFNVDDLINKLKNYFFSKVILDATSIINFATKDVVAKLASSIGAERLIIFLPVGVTPPEEFTNLLVDLKIYNFSNNIDEVVGFIDNPNTYENIIAKRSTINESSEFYVDNSIKADQEYLEDSNIESNENDNIINNSENDFAIDTDDNLDVSKDNETDKNNDFTIIDNYQNINNNNENNTAINSDLNSVIYNTSNNSFNSSNKFITINQNVSSMEDNYSNKKIYGIKNVTANAGSTTITYLLKKYLEEKFNKRVLAVEVNKDDFKVYQMNNMVNASNENLRDVCLNNNSEIILVDLNDYYGNFDYFKDIIYLVEPSLIKLNKLMMENRFVFHDLQDKKIILNKSLLSNSDVKELSKEAGVEFLMNIPPLNDRINNDIIKEMINILKIN